MDFEWTEEERAGRDRVAATLDAARVARLAAASRSPLPALRAELLDLQQRLGEAGYWDVALDPDDRCATARLAMDLELARASASFLVAVQATRCFAGLVAAHGSAALRAELLGSRFAGGLVGAVAWPADGGIADGTPVATAEPDGSWTLRGARPFVANAPLCDHLAVFADAGGKPLAALVSPARQGLKLGERLALVGLDGLATCAIELDGVRLPPDRVLGPFDGAGPALRLRREIDLAWAAAAVGRMQSALAVARAHAESHRRGGKPLVARQEIAFKLAEMVALAQTAELLVRRAAWATATADPEAEVLVRCARVFGAETAERVASAAMQVLASAGCVAGNEVERSWRDVRTLAALGTTVEVSRMAIADALLARV